MTDIALEGSCLCGATAYTARGSARRFYHCHCSRCRKVSGSAHSANLLIRADQIQWLGGEDRLGRYELPVATVDERYTSIEAERVLKAARAGGSRGRIRKEDVDSAAAVFIAERYLASA